MDKRLKQIADTYGYDAQSRQCIEEMAELTQAINKFWRERLDCGSIDFYDWMINNGEFIRSKDLYDISEEIADVEIMLEQMKYLLNLESDVENQKEMKIKRQLKRIEIEDNV
jgi:NTP pyrophosphatase (non-canonical NTP hydrolase)